MRQSLLRPIAAVLLAAAAATCATRSSPGPQALPPPSDPAVARALASISTTRLRDHIRLLADDRFKGRGTGTKEHEEAAAYVAAQLGALGLEPAGDGGTWLQQVSLREAKLTGATMSWVPTAGEEPRPLVTGKDFVALGDLAAKEANLDAEVVFVGYGISAPELGYDDYAGIDVRGKVVLRLNGTPERFPTDPKAYYSSGLTKTAAAAERGVIGILTASGPKAEKERPYLRWEAMVRRSGRPRMTWLSPAGVPGETPPTIVATVAVSRDTAAKLFTGASIPWNEALTAVENGTPRSLPLATRVAITTKSEHRALASPNVAGVWRGADPARRDEYVVYSTHLDHLGVGRPVRGDSIYNGAYDNASGVAVMLEVARAFAAQPARPARSVLFLFVTAEEKGLLGSEYFAAYPTVPRGAIVANVNVDQVLMLDPLAAIVAYGAEHSTLGPVVAEAAAQLGVEVVPDEMPKEVIFIRSDQYSFVRAGIPAVYPNPYPRPGDAGKSERRRMTKWLKEKYHSPQDEPGQRMNLESGRRFAALAFALGNSIAETQARPAWNDGDFFGTTFQQRP